MKHPDKYYQRFTATRCNRCSSKRYLVVHHIDGSRQNQKRDNLETLCSVCHRKEHAGNTHYWRRSEHREWAEQARIDIQRKLLEDTNDNKEE